MRVLDQVGSLLRSEVDRLLWQIFFMVLCLCILGHVLTWTKDAADGLLPESSYRWTKVLWVLVENRVLAKGRCVKWLQVVSWTWRNILLFFIIHHLKIGWALSLSSQLLFKAKWWALPDSSRYCWVIYGPVHCLLWVICSRTYFSWIVGFGEIVLSLRFAVGPFDATFWRGSHRFACWVDIVGPWA